MPTLKTRGAVGGVQPVFAVILNTLPLAICASSSLFMLVVFIVIFSY